MDALSERALEKLRLYGDESVAVRMQPEEATALVAYVQELVKRENDLRERLDAVFGDPEEEPTLSDLVDSALRNHAIGWGYAGQESMIREAHERAAELMVQLLDRMKPWAQWPRDIHLRLSAITLALAEVPNSQGEPLPSPVRPLRRAAHLVKHLIQQVDEFTGVVSPDGHREDDAIRDDLHREAIEWERIADRIGGIRA